MRVLVDTSVWVEFFSPKPVITLASLESLIQERNVATCWPVKAEVLSGKMNPVARRSVERAFDAMDSIDLDWNSSLAWDLLVKLSLEAQKRKLSIPGLVDRMILACCMETGSQLWTLDLKLKKLCHALRYPIFTDY